MFATNTLLYPVLVYTHMVKEEEQVCVRDCLTVPPTNVNTDPIEGVETLWYMYIAVQEMTFNNHRLLVSSPSL